MQKSKTHYWAIFQDREVIFEGTFTECWYKLISTFGNVKLATLQNEGVKIARNN